MSEEEIKEAIKLFGREDLLSEYGIQDTDTNIEVFMSVKDMIKYYKQDKEIERLTKENKLLQDMDKILRNENTNLKLEIKRLNNIINELEKWLKEEVERLMTIEQSNNVIFLIGAYTEVLDKLNELKGVDKE